MIGVTTSGLDQVKHSTAAALDQQIAVTAADHAMDAITHAATVEIVATPAVIPLVEVAAGMMTAADVTPTATTNYTL